MAQLDVDTCLPMDADGGELRFHQVKQEDAYSPPPSSSWR